MKYVLRDVVDLLSMPLALIFGMLLIALLLRWRGHFRASLVTGIAALALVYLSSLEPVASALLGPLNTSASWPSALVRAEPRTLRGILDFRGSNAT
jgi:hypothetical protein